MPRSAASCEQRSGKLGRVHAGHCSRATHRGRPASNSGHFGSEPGGSMYGRAQTAAVERLWEHVALVVGAAAITAVCAQVSFGYPVPTTLQTFAVLGSGALLGARRGAAVAAALSRRRRRRDAGVRQRPRRPRLAHPGRPAARDAAATCGATRSRRSRSASSASASAAASTSPSRRCSSAASCLYATGLVWLHQALPTRVGGRGRDDAALRPVAVRARRPGQDLRGRGDHRPGRAVGPLAAPARR